MTEGSTTLFNLLVEPLIRVRQGNGEQHMTLPQVLEAMGGDRDLDFTALRAHQRHAWHAFLVQLAAMALHRAGEDNPKQTADRWLSLVRDMTAELDEPWCLVVDDLSKPAFMQPPVPEGSIDQKKWKSVATPGALDLLVTAKNHDVKGRLIHNAEIEHWVFAMVSLQTMEGFLGAGNYGIARMNGGFASRPGVAVAADPAWNRRFARDASILVNKRADLVADPWPYADTSGNELIWIEPWDGTDSLSLSKCDPFFIEICRRVRLISDGSVPKAFTLSTKAARISAKEINGVTGDPWTPIAMDERGAKALTVPATGFDYRLLQKLLFSGEFKHGIAWRQKEESGDLYFEASVMTRGQGKTEGLHRRELRIPPHVSSLFADTDGRDRLASFSKRRIETSDIVRRKILHMALCMITQGAPDGDLDFRDHKTERWLSALDRKIDSIFFDHLFSDLDLDDDSASDAWAKVLIDLALEQLEDALRSLPQSSIRRYRIESAATGFFFGLARKYFPDLYEDTRKGETNV